MKEIGPISVREIVAALTDPPHWHSYSIPMRERLGQQAHADFFDSHPSCLTEHGIKGVYHSKRDLDLLIRGRIDLIEKSEDRCRIVEFKTSLLSSEFSDPEEMKLPLRYSLQVRIYAYLYMSSLLSSEDSPSNIECEVLIHNPTDGSEREFQVAWHPVEVESEFERYVEVHLRTMEELKAEADRRRSMAGHLQWQFDGFRRGQKEIVESVDQTFKDGGDVLIAAPTGIGKTMGVLYPALKRTLESGGQLFFATAKSSGRNPATSCILSLSSDEVPLRAMVMPPRPDLCLSDPMRCNPLDCKFFNDMSDDGADLDLPEELLKPGVITANSLKEAGEAKRICPVLLARRLSLKADIVIGDYNYVYSPKARLPQFREQTQVNWTLLLDEAHNLFDRVRRELSTEIVHNDIEHCRQLLSDELWLHVDEPSANDLAEGLGALMAVFERYIDNLSSEGLVPIELDSDEWGRLCDRIGKAMSSFMMAIQGRLDRDLYRALWCVYDQLQDFATALQRDQEAYFSHGDGSKRSLGIICLDPAGEMKAVNRIFQNIAAFSGTITPLDFHAEALGFGARPTAKLEISGWIDGRRRIIVHAPGVDTRFRARPREAARIASIIKQFVNKRQGGYLGVLPSFEFLDLVSEYLLNETFEVLVQSRSMGAGERRELRSGLERSGETTLALVVAGGQFTEAENYPGDACVGVIVVSPCLPPPDLEREALRDYWDRRGEDGYAVAYLYPGVRRVVQAAGRLFRREDDRGVVLLVGDRFTSQPIYGLLPDDWRESMADDNDGWLERVAAFWHDFEEGAV